MPDHRTIIDVFENTVEVPFDPRWTKDIPIDVLTARRLAEAVKPYYENFRFPQKDPGDIRPYISPRFITGRSPLSGYVGYTSSSHAFDQSNATDILAFLKPFLLYSHGVAFLDPLPYLLDFFNNSGQETDIERAYLPAMRHLLLEYVKIAELIRYQIVIPISSEFFGEYSHNQFFPTDSEKREIMRLLASSPRYRKLAGDTVLSRFLGSLIKEQLWLNQRAEKRIDLYFPHNDYLPVLQGLFNATSNHYSSSDISEPFTVGILADLTRLHTSQISVNDIISIRAEHAFEDYRRVMRRILQRLQSHDAKFSDIETEFAVVAREEIAECDERIKKLTKSSNVLQNTMKSLDRVLVGGAVGSVGGLLAGSSALAALGAAAGATSPLYDILRGSLSALPHSNVRMSLRNHFLVLDPSFTASRR